MGTATQKQATNPIIPVQPCGRSLLPEGYREVVLVLSQKEAGATPVKASNEDVTQMDRVLASEASSHRFDPCHPRSWKLASLAPKPTNGRLQDWGSIPHVSTRSPGRQVGRRWSAKPTSESSILSLESNYCSVA